MRDFQRDASDQRKRRSPRKERPQGGTTLVSRTPGIFDVFCFCISGFAFMNRDTTTKLESAGAPIIIRLLSHRVHAKPRRDSKRTKADLRSKLLIRLTATVFSSFLPVCCPFAVVVQ